MKFNLSSITIMLLYVITVMSSTPKKDIVDAQSTSGSQDQTSNVPWDAKMKIQKKNSLYTGVSWHSNTKKWKVKLMHKYKDYYGGLFDNEEHAAMKINLLCDEYGIKRKNLTIDIDPDIIQKIQNTTSLYTGVSWHSDNKKWQAQFTYNKKQYYGGLFDNEEHAAMKINLLCDEYGIKRKNSTIDIEPHEIQKILNTTSLYTGVSWHSDNKKWQTNLNQNGKQYYGGLFDNEEHAAMKINLLCDAFGIKRKNSTIDIEPHEIRNIQNTTSIYTGVSWNSDNKKWHTYLNHNGKRYNGGYFDNEEHAAIRVNLLCDEHGIIRKNLTIHEETDVIQKKIKSNIDQSKKESIIKTEEESILHGFNDQCENNFMKSEEKEINNDTAVSSYKIQKRKRTKQLLDYK